MSKFNDTICAPASSAGSGAICIIRLSGVSSFEICDKVVSFKKGNTAAFGGYTIHFGQVLDGGTLVDEVLVAVFKAPHSYTGEDGVEIYCHASRFIAGRIMDLLCAAGARPAGPGEFTQRAFVNGKMDLAQSEAVADVIAAESEAAHRVAISQLKGHYSTELRSLRDAIVKMAALMELELDFSEEEVEFANRSELDALLAETLGHVDRLADSFRSGNALKCGVPVAIVGDVNSGKSTLLNALVGEDRAIVSDIAGTTRDTVEETMNLGGITFRFIDTAGIRETSDIIEKKGIERSFGAIRKADVVIGVLDAMTPLDDCVKSACKIIGCTDEKSSLIIVRNKVDLFDAINPEDFPTLDRSYGIFELKYPAFGTYSFSPEELAGKIQADLPGFEREIVVLDISARTGEGLDELRKRISATQDGRFSTECGNIVTNSRHFAALNQTSESLRKCREGLSAGLSTELVAEDLRDAISSLNSIFGEAPGSSSISAEDWLGEIFGRFCIGK